MRLMLSLILAAALAVPMTACAQTDAPDITVTDNSDKLSDHVLQFRYFFDVSFYKSAGGNAVLYQQVLDNLYEELEPAREMGENPMLGIRRADLNNDGIEDAIVSLGNEYLFCDKVDCDKYIFGYDGETVTRLGAFQKAAIALGNQDTNGIKDLKVFTNPVNIYDFNVAKWNVATSSYELEMD